MLDVDLWPTHTHLKKKKVITTFTIKGFFKSLKLFSLVIILFVPNNLTLFYNRTIAKANSFCWFVHSCLNFPYAHDTYMHKHIHQTCKHIHTPHTPYIYTQNAYTPNTQREHIHAHQYIHTYILRHTPFLFTCHVLSHWQPFFLLPKTPFTAYLRKSAGYERSSFAYMKAFISHSPPDEIGGELGGWCI